MAEVEGQGVPTTQVAERPAARTREQFIATAPLAEVKAKLKEARNASASQEQSRRELNGRAVDASSSVESDESARDAAQENEQSDQQFESDDESGQENQQGKQKRSKKEPEFYTPEQWRTLSANAKQAADERAALAKELADIKSAQEQRDKEAATEAQRQEYLGVMQRIQNHPTATPEEKRQAVQAYQQQLLMQGLNGFGEHVQTREQQVAQREHELEVQSNRMKLPEYVGSIVNFVGEKNAIPTDYVKGVTETDTFRNLTNMYESPRDLHIMGEVLFAIGEYEAKREAQRAEENRQSEVNFYEENNQPTRVVNRQGAAGGKTTAQRIETGVASKDWPKYVKALKKYGNPSAALNALKSDTTL